MASVNFTTKPLMRLLNVVLLLESSNFKYSCHRSSHHMALLCHPNLVSVQFVLPFGRPCDHDPHGHHDTRGVKMSRPTRQAAWNATPPSVPSRAVDVARRAHKHEGTRDPDFQNPAGKVLVLSGPLAPVHFGSDEAPPVGLKTYSLASAEAASSPESRLEARELYKIRSHRTVHLQFPSYFLGHCLLNEFSSRIPQSSRGAPITTKTFVPGSTFH